MPFHPCLCKTKLTKQYMYKQYLACVKQPPYGIPRKQELYIFNQ